MEELRTEVQEVMENELKRANESFPLFRSDHEGIAVIREEVTEAREEFHSIREICRDLETAVFKDKPIREKHSIARQGVIAAIAGACEMIQTAAMFDKFRTSMDERKSEENKEYDMTQEELNSFVDGFLDANNYTINVKKFLDKLEGHLEAIKEGTDEH